MPLSFNHSTKLVYSLPLALQKGTLIDFETTGIPHKTSSHEIVTLGYCSKNKLIVLQRTTKEKEPFYTELKQLFSALPKPFYAYNACFEKAIMQIELDLEVNDADFIDIMRPYRKKAEELCIKWPRLDDLISEPEDYFREQKISGKDVPALWSKYLISGDATLLEKIMLHCFSDVLREWVLVVKNVAFNVGTPYWQFF
jgi:uncharacterized protein YprB with RNaseH-like and TPR domain